ncbi:MAG: PadR family transcriptional regulator [Actinobacteria bacterium 13_2_20CM_2_72_6]|nr:MAG: PadR family transcriptional regulator [Actinobacteria bacterium 13_2_20CM_2_72_6]
MGTDGQPRLTPQTVSVLRAFLEAPTRERYGLEIGAMAGLPSGTIHPILSRLEEFGWLRSHWEDVDPRESGRPRRRYYSLEPGGGERAARQAVARADAKRARALRLRPNAAGGLS